ncbi:MAG: pilus assembly protein PilM [Candidatus Omnitrophota bacterium]
MHLKIAKGTKYKLPVFRLPKFMAFKRFALRKPIVVIEIGNDWLKIAENRYPAGSRIVSRLDFKKIADIDGSMTAAISKIFSILKLDKHSVISYIPRHLATVRILELPATDPKEINEMVSLLAIKQTPYSKEEIVSAYKTISCMKEGYTKVMLVIVRQNIIADRLETLKGAGISSDRVALSTEGIYNWLSSAYPEELKPDSPAFILLDVDSNYSDFIVIRNGRLSFTRNILIGANQLTDEKKDWRESFIEELKHSMGLYQNEERDVKLSKILLSGAAGNVEYLDTTLSSRLDIPSSFTDPRKNLRFSGDMAVFDEDRYKNISTSALFGIAVRDNDIELDLTPQDIRLRRMMENKRRELMFTGILSVSIIMLACMILVTNISNKNSYLAQLKKKISQIESGANEVDRMRTRMGLIEKRLDANGSSIDMFIEILNLTPPDISLTFISIEEKQKVVLKGRARAMSNIFKFVTTLEGSRMFSGVKPTYTTTQKDQSGEFAEFEIVCSYERLR